MTTQSGPISPTFTRQAWHLLAALLLLLGTALSVAYALTRRAAGTAPKEKSQRAMTVHALDTLPLYFIENRGQADSRARYYVRGRDMSVYFSPDGLTFAIAGAPAGGITPVTFTGSARRRWLLSLDFVGADRVQPRGEEPTTAVVSYLKGHPDEWKTGLKTYGKIVYRDLWPGIDLAYSGTVNRLKYQFVVRPGADSRQIRLAYRGATGLHVDQQGGLRIATPGGGFHDEKPYAYQDIAGRHADVPASYALIPESEHPMPHSRAYGFTVGDYDRSQPLVLDPAVLVYAGYIGGSGSDQGFAIAVDGSGSAYVTGSTFSDEVDSDGNGPDIAFPVTGGAFDTTFNGIPAFADAFVVKVNAAGTGLDYVTYIGGSGEDSGRGITVDELGNAYVVGSTASDEVDSDGPGPDTAFPVTPGAFDTTFNNPGVVDPMTGAAVTDTFVAKLNATGTALLYTTYIGGVRDDAGGGIAIDAAHYAYITGESFSDEVDEDGPGPDVGFPVTVGPDLTYNSVGNPTQPDTFVAKLDPAGARLEYCGYIGGFGGEKGRGIAVDGSGNAYVTGETSSAEFPVTPGAFDTTFNGGGGPPFGPADAYVAKLNPEGTALVYATFIGGSGDEVPRSIAVGDEGNAYITGETSSTEATFPDGDGFGSIPGVNQTFNTAGGADPITGSLFREAFVANVNPTGTDLVYAGYIGGEGVEVGQGIAIDHFGNAYIAGRTSSSEESFPVVAGPDSTFNSAGTSDPMTHLPFSDAFVAKLTPSGTSLVYSGYIGGIAADVAFGIAVDGFGNAYVVGATPSNELTFPVTIGPDVTFNGGGPPFFTDAFIAKVVSGGRLLVTPGALHFGTVKQGRFKTRTFTLHNDSLTEETLAVSVGDPDLPFSLVSGGGTSVLNPGETQRVTVRFDPTAPGSVTGSIPVSSSDPASPSLNVELIGRGL
jgi:hypothetical protein